MEGSADSNLALRLATWLLVGSTADVDTAVFIAPNFVLTFDVPRSLSSFFLAVDRDLAVLVVGWSTNTLEYKLQRIIVEWLDNGYDENYYFLTLTGLNGPWPGKVGKWGWFGWGFWIRGGYGEASTATISATTSSKKLARNFMVAFGFLAA